MSMMVEPQRAIDDVPFPVIPAEISSAILEALVEIQTAGATAKLATLSRSLKPFIERLLYRSICLPSHRQLLLFLDLIRSDIRPLSFYQDRIRHFCATTFDLVKIGDMIALVSACPNARTFALRSFNYHRSEALAALNFYSSLSILRPIRLQICLMKHLSTNSPPGVDWLCKVTHLELLIRAAGPTHFDGSALERLPQLTHLSYCCIYPSFVASSFAASLRLSAGIVVCIVWDPHPGMTVLLSLKERDPRIVLRYGKDLPPEASEYSFVRDWSTKSFIQDWSQKGAEPDIWELAEAEAKVELQRKHLQMLQDVQKSS
ncbi:hypothetical protein C8J56DRAFT_976677 [Mycena floridula]|nr:hypothetical protein C8J56DRAFT_976677 [Mycena floridula]